MMAIDHAGQLNRNVEPGTGGVWGKVFHDKTSVDADYDNGASGFDVKTWGFLGGYDRQVSEKTAFGVYLGASRPKLTNNDYGNISGDDFQIGIYGSWKLPSNNEFNMSIGGGWQSYDAWRVVNIERSGLTPYREHLGSDYDGSSFDIALEFAHLKETEKSWIRPAISYNYQSTHLDGFTERGNLAQPGYSVAQSVDSSSFKQQFLKLGLSGGWKNTGSDIHAKLFWVGRISGDDRPDSVSRFISPTGVAGGDVFNSSFRIQGAEMDKNYFNFGLGFTKYLNDSKTTSLSLDYEALLGSKRKDHLFDVTLNVKF